MALYKIDFYMKICYAAKMVNIKPPFQQLDNQGTTGTALIELIHANGLALEELYTREIHAESVPQALMTGNDRTASSTLYNDEESDFDGGPLYEQQAMKQHGVHDASLTSYMGDAQKYLNTLTDLKPDHAILLYRKSVDIVDINPYDYGGNGYISFGFKLFKMDPRRSLVGVIQNGRFQAYDPGTAPFTANTPSFQ